MAADYHRQIGPYARIREQAIRELKQGRTWKQVGEIIGTSYQQAAKLANRHP